MPRYNVLIVDDDVDFADGLAEVVAILGHKVKTASSADAAQKELAKTRFDVAFIDIGMSRRNGVELILDIRRVNTMLNCILMTGYSPEVISKFDAESANVPIVTKPLNLDTVSELLSI